MATPPKAKREALLAELLGDLGPLLDQAEALRESLPAATDKANERLLKSAAILHLSVQTEYTRSRLELRKLTRKTRRAQSINRQLARQLDALIFSTAILSGVLGKASRRLRDRVQAIVDMVRLWLRPFMLAGAIMGAARRGKSRPEEERSG